mmetsp:Transcript_9723/g.13650  ORF Transcript_9723/g.13650 Transcript_9723/m.13650 type:complete len:569 (-) Transcript_9723:13-1719(-)|eukprot:CAMPEP_0171472368 /NCGR_PEP_ID=MMETSP0946-20130122/1234_1 /TAXON_ID=109269 /ORGANISM="Vaucheria litorea, Strain CCMP2940" /LENGTH=568 /DNA_ID=CAMNT_0012001987 /DNA_START=14 /DNA_END=1720 /DNA_ORIENTATION=-
MRVLASLICTAALSFPFSQSLHSQLPISQHRHPKAVSSLASDDSDQSIDEYELVANQDRIDNDFAFDFPRLNNTQLSLRVEAELLDKYDKQVPGPAEGHAARPLPINVDLLSYMAKEAMRKRNSSEAVRLYRRCVELDPRDGRGWMGLARFEMKQGNYQKARSIFELGLKNSPNNPYLLQACGVMEEKLGLYKRALELYVKATRVDPGHAASWVALAMLYKRRNRISEAKRCLQAATKADSSNYYAWQAWGVLENSLGNFDEAREKFKLSSKANPRNSALYQAWGVMEAKLGNHDIAKELFQRGIREHPSSCYTLQAWAVMEAKLGNTYLATQLFQKALKLNPKDAAVYQAYGLLQRRMGYITKARNSLEQAIKVDPRHTPSWQVLGSLEAEIGNIAKARDIFQQGVWACVNQKVRLFQSWGVMEAKLGEYEAARRCFKFGLEQDPKSIPVLVAWALMEEQAKSIVRARELFEVAISIKSGHNFDPNVWNAYEAMETRLGNLQGAKSVYERGLSNSFGKQNNRQSAQIKWDLGPIGEDLFSNNFGSETFGNLVWTNDYMNFQYIKLGI